MNKGYYYLKPLIPRSLQLFARRERIKRKYPNCSTIWPINEITSAKPEGWKGWPDGKKFALILTHDVELTGGHNKCIDLMSLEMDLGFRSSFDFVPERYEVSQALRQLLVSNGFEICVHGLKHDGKEYFSRKIFLERANKINKYLKEWNAVGYRSPSMHHNLEWLHDLNVEYDMSTFDTDPFEPQSDAIDTIFPFWVPGKEPGSGYVEMPYTLPQDFTLYILMGEQNIDIWKRKLDWIAEKGGMALINVHPDYMNFGNRKNSPEEFPATFYRNFLEYVKSNYAGSYWHVLPKEMSEFIKGNRSVNPKTTVDTLSDNLLKEKLVNRKSTGVNFKMKYICMITQSCYITDSRVRRQAEILSNAGYKVDIINLYHKGREKIEKFGSVTTYGILNNGSREGIFKYLGFSILFFINAFIKLQFLSLKRKYELIEVHNMPESLVFTAIFQKIQGIPVILDIHDLTPELFKSKWKKSTNSLLISFIEFIERISCSFSDKVITVTDGCKKLLVQRKVPKEKITLILNSPDQDIFKYDTRREFKEITSGANFLYHGTVAERFGIHIAIEAMVHINKVIPCSVFRIYGKFDENYKNKLIRLIDSLGLNDNILIGGLVTLEEINVLIKKSDIGIVPYVNDYYMNLALSTKTLEYAACGLPVVTTRLQTIRSLFDDNSILYTDSDNPEDIAQKVIKLCFEPELRRNLSTNAYKTLEGISWQVMESRYLKLINSVLSKDAEKNKLVYSDNLDIEKKLFKKVL
jgi:glycosyltransferase involved in cell wall biosynthesis